jgi:hypothetical protein
VGAGAQLIIDSQWGGAEDGRGEEGRGAPQDLSKEIEQAAALETEAGTSLFQNLRVYLGFKFEQQKIK